MSGLYSAIEDSNDLYWWLATVVAELRDRWGQVDKFGGPFGDHGVVYGESDEGEFATVGFTLPDDVYAVIEGDTYAELQGFRIFREDLPQARG